MLAASSTASPPRMSSRARARSPSAPADEQHDGADQAVDEDRRLEAGLGADRRLHGRELRGPDARVEPGREQCHRRQRAASGPRRGRRTRRRTRLGGSAAGVAAWRADASSPRPRHGPLTRRARASGGGRLVSSAAARYPLRRAPSISACHSPAVCSPAKWSRPTGAASAASSISELHDRAEYAPRTQGSVAHVLITASSGRIARSGRMSTTDAIQASGPSSTASRSRASGDPANDAATGSGPPSGASWVNVQKRSRTHSVALGAIGRDERQEQLRRGAIADRGQRPGLGLGERRVERDQVDDRGRDRDHDRVRLDGRAAGGHADGIRAVGDPRDGRRQPHPIPQPCREGERDPLVAARDRVRGEAADARAALVEHVGVLVVGRVRGRDLDAGRDRVARTVGHGDRRERIDDRPVARAARARRPRGPRHTPRRAPGA